MTNGKSYLNNLIYLKGGYGDFVLRRIAGLSRILNPTTGQYQIRDGQNNYIEQYPVFGVGADDIGVAPELVYPELGGIRFDLANILLPTNSATSQIVFQGVRRMKGNPGPNPSYRAIPKSFTYTMEATVTAGAGFVTARTVMDNYDFELHQVIVAVERQSQNLALSFDQFAGAVETEHYYEQGTGQSLPTASPLLSSVGSLADPINNTNQVSQPGPWIESDTVRYQILIDYTGLKLRAYRSSDSGATWTEQDAADAPSVNNNSAPPTNYNMFAVARDTDPAVKNVYCVFWDTDNTLSAITFDMATNTWGTKHKSTLAYLDTSNVTIFEYGLAGVFRPSDGSMIVALNVNTVTIGLDAFDRVYYAKFNTGSSTWDAAWTPCGSTDATEQNSWFCSGLVLEPATNNVHFQFFLQARSPNPYHIYHQVLHPANSLSTPDLVVTIPFLRVANPESFLCRPIGRAIPAGGTELLFPWNQTDAGTGDIQAWVARGAASDAPTWTTELMLDPGNTPTGFNGFQFTDMGDGTVRAIATPGQTGGNANWIELVNAGPGLGWTQTLLTTVLNSTTPNPSAISVVPASAFSPLGALTDSVCALWIYDRNRVQISNVPILDLFCDGGPQGIYRNGAVVTPLWYPKESQIQIDFYPILTSGSARVVVYLVGKKWFPC